MSKIWHTFRIGCFIEIGFLAVTKWSRANSFPWTFVEMKRILIGHRFEMEAASSSTTPPLAGACLPQFLNSIWRNKLSKRFTSLIFSRPQFDALRISHRKRRRASFSLPLFPYKPRRFGIFIAPLPPSPPLPPHPPSPPPPPQGQSNVLGDIGVPSGCYFDIWIPQPLRFRQLDSMPS